MFSIYFQNGMYIGFGFLSAVGTMVSTGLSLHVLIPTIIKISEDVDPEIIARDLNFTNWHKR